MLLLLDCSGGLPVLLSVLPIAKADAARDPFEPSEVSIVLATKRQACDDPEGTNDVIAVEALHAALMGTRLLLLGNNAYVLAAYIHPSIHPYIHACMGAVPCWGLGIVSVCCNVQDASD